MHRHAILILTVLSLAACSQQQSPTDPTPAPAGEVHYTALGASDAIGFGSSAPCIPFTACPDGAGYVQAIARRLQGDGKTVTLVNLGIPGAVLGPNVQAIGNSMGLDIFGNFLEREMPFVSAKATVVTIFAGANDVNTIGSALKAGLAGPNLDAYVQNQVENFGRDMRTLLAGIRDRAPQARVVVLNLPNMAGLPYAAGYPLSEKRWLQQIAVGFSAQVNALSSPNALVVDLMCDASFYQSHLFSTDGFHPNDAGYAYLTQIVFGAISTGTVAAPRASCAQMTLY